MKSRLIRFVVMTVIIVVLAVGSFAGYWYFRPNTSIIDPAIELEHWVGVQNEWHNSNTDMIHWKGQFYMIYAESPSHFTSELCRLVVRFSDDARAWTETAQFRVPGEDIRDPKFAIIDNRLFVYVFKNISLDVEPYGTQYSYTEDGENWTPLNDVPDQKGWLLWRPKSLDNKTWYVPAYWHEHGKSILLKGTDGIHWDTVSTIYDGDRNDETDIEFMADGRMMATARLEFGDSICAHPEACTFIGTAEPPYTKWKGIKSEVTRFDGPCLFSYNGEVYGIGRHNPQPPRPYQYRGSLFSKKRTSLYHFTPEGMTWLSDFPSAGDTSYAGIVQKDGFLYACYYTSDIRYDWPWVIGMYSPSDILMVKFPLANMEKLAQSRGQSERD